MLQDMAGLFNLVCMPRPFRSPDPAAPTLRVLLFLQASVQPYFWRQQKQLLNPLRELVMCFRLFFFAPNPLASGSIPLTIHQSQERTDSVVDAYPAFATMVLLLIMENTHCYPLD